jgi:ferrous iron transport protein A
LRRIDSSAERLILIIVRDLKVRPVRRLSEFDLPSPGEGVIEATPAVALSSGRKGFSGAIVAVHAADTVGGLGGDEIERRLLEMGLVEGAPVEIVHEGFFGRDPIAIRLADRTVALRRREARSVMVRVNPANDR